MRELVDLWIDGLAQPGINRREQRTEDNIQQSTSNIQKSPNIQAPKDNSRGLGFGTRIFSGCWMLAPGCGLCPSLRSLRLIIGKSGARCRLATRCWWWSMACWSATDKTA